MRVPHFLCNSCVKTSPDTSEWWTVEVTDGEVPALAISPFVMASGDKDKIAHACSRPCAARIVGHFLFSARVDPSKKKKVRNPYSIFNSMFLGHGSEDDNED